MALVEFVDNYRHGCQKTSESLSGIAREVPGLISFEDADVPKVKKTNVYKMETGDQHPRINEQMRLKRDKTQQLVRRFITDGSERRRQDRNQFVRLKKSDGLFKTTSVLIRRRYQFCLTFFLKVSLFCTSFDFHSVEAACRKERVRFIKFLRLVAPTWVWRCSRARLLNV